MVKTFKEIRKLLRDEKNDYSYSCEYKMRCDFKKFCNPTIIGIESQGNIKGLYRYSFKKEDWDKFLEYTRNYTWAQSD